MTLSKIRALQNVTLSTFAREVVQTASEWDLGIILHELDDSASIEEVDARLVEAWENFVDLGLITPAEDETDDLMDGNLEDQLANLLVAGDEEDRRTRYNTADLTDPKEPRHAMDDLEKRYVILTKLRGRYMPDVASDDLDYIMHEAADIAYQSLDAALHEAKNGGEASITVFDRDEDRDLYHVELIYYPKEVR